MEEKYGIDYLFATIDSLSDIINRASTIFFIPSKLESSLKCARQMLVDKEDDTIQRQMFRMTGFKRRPSTVIPPGHMEFYLEYCFTESKIAKMFGVSSKTILRMMAEFGLHKKPYSTLSDMELNIFWISYQRWLIFGSVSVINMKC